MSQASVCGSLIAVDQTGHRACESDRIDGDMRHRVRSWLISGANMFLSIGATRPIGVGQAWPCLPLSWELFSTTDVPTPAVELTRLGLRQMVFIDLLWHPS